MTIVGGSEDYRGICLMADEGVTLQMPTVRDIIRTAYLPVAEWGQPVVHIPDDSFDRLRRRMHEVKDYQFSSHRFRSEAQRTLYTLFLLDLTDIQERAISTRHHGERTTELFVGFMRLLPQHFIEHHDIAFYASELCITPTHLSRIVRQVTGRTVVDYINQMLLMEASFLLQTTDLPLAAIARRLCFADQSSFSKFFLRMKGVGPKRFRMER
ncbi:MAG: AraC family transcriptional regulator [Bacteroidaceae bacterium]|nr:AraC family transcriptional regulator [Bacteroidaceae bacterium]